jgi:uncharacterized protein (TIGR02611 family)
VDQLADPAREERLAERLARRRARHRQRGPLHRLGVVAAGFAVTAAGLAMLVLPGPALVVIPIGLALLALEFAWAERALVVAVRRAEQARHGATRLPARARALVALVAIAAAGVAAVAALRLELLPL